MRFDLEPDTPGFDLVVSYADRPGVLYRDQLGGNYQAVDLKELPAASRLLPRRISITTAAPTWRPNLPLVLLNRPGGFQKAPPVNLPPAVAADFDGNGRLDRASIRGGALTIDRDMTPELRQLDRGRAHRRQESQVALGAKVEVKAGTSYEKQTYEGLPLVFRLGSRTQRGHGAHHLAERPDPERNEPAGEQAGDHSRKRSGFPAPAP